MSGFVLALGVVDGLFQIPMRGNELYRRAAGAAAWTGFKSP